MGRSNIHLDILMGRDETLEPQDFFLGWSAVLACVANADFSIRNGAGLSSESSLGNGEEVALVLKNRVVGVLMRWAHCMYMFGRELVSVRVRRCQLSSTQLISIMSIQTTTDPFDAVLQPRPSISEPSLQSGPLPLFDHHLKLLTDSFLNFFQERYVSP